MKVEVYGMNHSPRVQAVVKIMLLLRSVIIVIAALVVVASYRQTDVLQQ